MTASTRNRSRDLLLQAASVPATGVAVVASTFRVAAMRSRRSPTSIPRPSATLSSTREEGSFSPRSISARYEMETCAPSATCRKVSPFSVRIALSVSPMAESRSVFRGDGWISRVFIIEILYPLPRKRQLTSQLLDETHLLGVRLRGRVTCLHPRRNPRRLPEKLHPGPFRDLALPDP